MKINIKAINLDITPSLTTYINEKLGALSKFLKKFDEKGVAELWLEVARTTKHHRKGEVFEAAADLRLPKKILRAEEESGDVRTAIDSVKDKLHLEIEKYRTRFEDRKDREKQRALRGK